MANMNPICVACWNPDALVVMHLDGSGYFECQECNETFHCEAVREKLDAMKAGWEKMLKWAESYPGGIKPRADA